MGLRAYIEIHWSRGQTFSHQTYNLFLAIFIQKKEKASLLVTNHLDWKVSPVIHFVIE